MRFEAEERAPHARRPSSARWSATRSGARVPPRSQERGHERQQEEHGEAARAIDENLEQPRNRHWLGAGRGLRDLLPVRIRHAEFDGMRKRRRADHANEDERQERCRERLHDDATRTPRSRAPSMPAGLGVWDQSREGRAAASCRISSALSPTRVKRSARSRASSIGMTAPRPTLAKEMTSPVASSPAASAASRWRTRRASRTGPAHERVEDLRVVLSPAACAWRSFRERSRDRLRSARCWTTLCTIRKRRSRGSCARAAKQEDDGIPIARLMAAPVA